MNNKVKCWFFVSVLGVGVSGIWMSCKQTESNNTTTTTASISGTKTFADAVAPTPTPFLDTLLSRFWSFEFYVSAKQMNGGNQKSEVGRWYRFYGDGKFVSGQWEKAQNKGSYFITPNGPNGFPILNVDSDNPAHDGSWEIQNHPGDDRVMTWVGMPKTASEDYMVKAVGLLSTPFPEQLGKKN